MMVPAKPWRLRRAPLGSARPWEKLALACALPDWVARLAWMRGMDGPEDLAWRLDPQWSRTTDPFLLPGVEAAVARILKAIAAKERIGVYGDYDVDGVTATALLLRVLERMGADVFFFIPNRFNDGYGLHLDCIQELAAREKPGLLISVDCGVRSVEEVAHSRELGVEWIITDHHAMGEALPQACAVVHPHLNGYENRGLAGVGVAFKLAQALLDAAPHPKPKPKDQGFLDGLLKLVAIGTLADMMPLVGENALLVKRGLQALSGGNGPGLVALLKAARCEGPVRSQDIAFGVAPRLNAVGRMGGAEDAVRLLLCRDAAEAEGLMARVEALNQDRRVVQRGLSASLPAPGEAPFDLVVEPQAHKGVIGIVAGQRMRDSGRPTAVCMVLDGVAHCSLRAPEGFDLGALLAQARPFLLGGGGHAAAAGMSFELAKLPFVRRVFALGAQDQAGRLSRPSVPLDGSGAHLLPEDAPLDALEPYGQAFPVPTVALEGVLASKVQVFGEGHWKLRLQGLPEPITWFYGESLGFLPHPGEPLRLAATPQASLRWGRSWLAQGLLGEQI